MMKYKVISLFGIRSDIIKFSSLFPLLDKHFNHIMVHSNQHYDYEMDGIFFTELNLRAPDYNLKVGSGTQAAQTAKIMLGFEKILLKEKPDAVVLQGDTNTAIAGSLTASKMKIPLMHVEGGARGFAKNEPEEINRKVADYASDLVFAPDMDSANNLKKEGFSKEKFFLSGNTSLDVCLRNVKLAKDNFLKKYNFKKNNFVVVTIHRSQNTNEKNRLQNIISALEEISSFCPVIFPVHPRTQKALEKFGIEIENSVNAIEPIGYLDFLGLMKSAKMIITDSAGIQEEAVFLNVPCLIAYNETPWVPYVKSGKNKLVGYRKERIVSAAKKLYFDGEYYKTIRKIPYDYYPNVSENIVKKMKSWLDNGDKRIM